MAHLDNTRPHSGTAHYLTVCLSNYECKLILPEIKTALRRERKRYEKFKDIYDAGIATENQQNKMWDAEENVNILEHIINTAEELIKIESQTK